MLLALQTALHQGPRVRSPSAGGLPDRGRRHRQRAAASFNEIAAGRGDARVFTVGIGSAPNSYLMTRAAEIGRGTFTHIGSEQQVAERMGELSPSLKIPS